MLRRRAVIFLRLRLPGHGYEAALGRLARRHDLIAIQVVDPRERELPDVGLVTLWDAGERGLARGGHVRPRAARAFPAAGRPSSISSWSARCGSAGADLLRLETGASYAEPLLAFFRRRESRLWR